MTKTPESRVLFEQLPLEARVLFYIIALATVARFDLACPSQRELERCLKTVWNANRFSQADLADPFRVTALLKPQENLLMNRACRVDNSGERQKQEGLPD
jgi:hypothetical protein